MRYIENTATLSYDESKCVGCGRCVEVCPHAVFEIKERTLNIVSASKISIVQNAQDEKPALAPRNNSKKRASIRDKDACMECGACAKNCPAEAIKVNAGVGCAYAIIKSKLTGKKACCC